MITHLMSIPPPPLVAGVQGGKLVEAHGSFASASCIKCKTKQDVEEVKVHTRIHTHTHPRAHTINYPCLQEAIFEKRLPRCKHKHCFVSQSGLANYYYLGEV